MERTALRLECLKLAYRVDRLPAEVISLATEYEKFVCAEDKTQEEPKKGASKKKTGNADILS